MNADQRTARTNTLRQVDLGLVHSSSASSPIENILNRLTTDGDFDKGISVRLLLKNWSAAFTEWPTKSVRDAIYASPQFPRILKGPQLFKTLSRKVSVRVKLPMSEKVPPISIHPCPYLLLKSKLWANAVSSLAACYGTGTNCLLTKLRTAKLSGDLLVPHHQDPIAHPDDLR
jgi:hypothetical protein